MAVAGTAIGQRFWRRSESSDNGLAFAGGGMSRLKIIGEACVKFPIIRDGSGADIQRDMRVSLYADTLSKTSGTERDPIL